MKKKLAKFTILSKQHQLRVNLSQMIQNFPHKVSEVIIQESIESTQLIFHIGLSSQNKNHNFKSHDQWPLLIPNQMRIDK